MNKVEIRKLLLLLEFFSGFLFGIAIFAGGLVFIMFSVSFLYATLMSVSVFSFFIFLALLVKYLIARIKIAQQSFDIQLESRIFQEQILRNMRRDSKLKLEKEEENNS